ncbi:MAG TPA: SDR family oxidoreductase [Longimicrobiales bacterium]
MTSPPTSRVFDPALLSGRTAIITGGGSGLGLAMARRFLSLGARVVIAGRSAERLEAAARELDAGDALLTHPADVRDYAQVEALVRAAADRFGGVDILVNNAAGNFLAATEELSPNGFHAVVATVLYGTFYATLAAGRLMIERGGGSILNILTTYAWTGSPFVVPSAAAKAGVLAMTRSLAVEWAAYGVRVNAIAPGPFPTEGAWSRLMPTPDLEAEARARIPMDRFGRPEELADLAAFLVSDAAPFINGECVTIDGGAWLASGGTFAHLVRHDRNGLKELFAKMRAR